MAQQNTTIQAIVGVIVAVFIIWYVYGGGSRLSVQRIFNEVADDAVKRYEIAKRNGDPMDVCVQAGMVVAAYLQAKDEKNYARWKDIEALECRHASVPR